MSAASGRTHHQVPVSPERRARDQPAAPHSSDMALASVVITGMPHA